MLIEYNGECSSSAGRAKWRKKCNRFQFVGMLLICVVSEIARKGNSPQASSNQRKKKSFLIKKIICTHFLGYFHAWTGQEHAKCRCLPSSCWAQKWIFLLHLDATFLGTDKNNSQHISIFAFIFDISIIWRSQFCCWWRWFFFAILFYLKLSFCLLLFCVPVRLILYVTIWNSTNVWWCSTFLYLGGIHALHRTASARTHNKHTNTKGKERMR